MPERGFHNQRGHHIILVKYEATEGYSCNVKEKPICHYKDIYVLITTYYIVISTYDGCRYNGILSHYNDILSCYNNI